MTVDLVGANQPPQDPTVRACFLYRTEFSRLENLTGHCQRMHVAKGTFDHDFPCPECHRIGKPDHWITGPVVLEQPRRDDPRRRKCAAVAHASAFDSG